MAGAGGGWAVLGVLPLQPDFTGNYFEFGWVGVGGLGWGWTGLGVGGARSFAWKLI